MADTNDGTLATDEELAEFFIHATAEEVNEALREGAMLYERLLRRGVEDDNEDTGGL